MPYDISISILTDTILWSKLESRPGVGAQKASHAKSGQQAEALGGVARGGGGGGHADTC